MVTIAELYSLNRAIRIIIGLTVLLTLTSCPDVEDCKKVNSITRVDDLILLTPEQSTYSQGDVVILSLTIPATNTYFGNERNLFLETGDDFARLALTFNQLFIDNSINIVKGSQGQFANWFNMPYNPENDSYELEVIITLNRVGSYSFVTDDSIEIIGNGCNRYRIDTNVLWSGDAIIEFTVQ